MVRPNFRRGRCVIGPDVLVPWRTLLLGDLSQKRVDKPVVLLVCLTREGRDDLFNRRNSSTSRGSVFGNR